MKTLHRVALAGFVAALFSLPRKRRSPRRRRPQPRRPPPRPAPSRSGSAARGPLQGDKAPRARSQSLDLDKLPLVDSQRFDAQYGASRAFRGIALASVITTFAPDPALDIAILHFANGMAVPVPFRDVAAMKRLDPFIARGMETHPKGPVRAALLHRDSPEGRDRGPASDRVLRQQAGRPRAVAPVARGGRPAGVLTLAAHRHADQHRAGRVAPVLRAVRRGRRRLGGARPRALQGELPVLPRRPQGGRPVRLGLRRARRRSTAYRKPVGTCSSTSPTSRSTRRSAGS